MSFISDAVLKQKLADCLARANVSTTPTWQTNIVSDANTDAYNQILSYLGAGGRGLTIAQIATWVLGAECQTELGLFFALMRTGLYKRISREQLDFYGRWIPDPASGRLTGLLSSTPLIDASNNLITPNEGSGPSSAGLMLMNTSEGGLKDYTCYPDMDW